MTPRTRDIIEEGRTAFAFGVPLSGNPYSTDGSDSTAPLESRLRDVAWSYGWLRERGVAEMQLLEERMHLLRDARYVARSATKKRLGTG